MKKHRSIPFGYTIADGRMTIQPEEADAIRRIFAEYAGGASMSELAALMTQLQIPYSEKSTKWNKNMVARILGNPKYAGGEGFDPIIDPDVFKETEAFKCHKYTKKHCQDSSTVGIFRASLTCAECGGRMVRMYDRRKKEPICWICDQPGCHQRVTISDELLESRVVDRLNLVIDNPDLLEMEEAYTMEESERAGRGKVAQELSRMCESGNYNDSQLITLILKGATDRYSKCPKFTGNTIAEVSLAFSNAQRQEELDTELFLKTVSTILLRQDGSILLRLKTGKEI